MLAPERATLEVRLGHGGQVVGLQFKGRRNREPSPEAKGIVEGWLAPWRRSPAEGDRFVVPEFLRRRPWD